MSLRSSAFLLLGRVLIAPLYFLSGLRKLQMPHQTIDHIAAAGLPLPVVGYAGSTALEVVGIVLLVLGWKARPVAAVLFVYTLMTAFFFHFKLADPIQFMSFLKNFAIAGGLLFIAEGGGGRWSVDEWLASRAAGRKVA
jgi:putative oxidoreductase